ncbi:hypothetical protein [Stygiolobus azoricus]|uniref:Uncharacterized protein n=1 Tax=Stygiolobus azoricus TaxID=41675 RepID=A0A650CNI7_9CREN|nr:hypothetical protein [Stygiolobus azoricus]QGR19232.1 hypothetical protein D1868_04060 [Stygiolobus azoricus]
MSENLILLLGLTTFTLANGVIIYNVSKKLKRHANYLLGEGKRKLILKFLEEGVEFFSQSSLSELLEEILIASKVEKEIKLDNIQKEIVDKAKVMNEEIKKIYNLSRLMIKIDNIAKELSIFSEQLRIISILLFSLSLVDFILNLYPEFDSYNIDILSCTIGSDLLAIFYLILLNWFYMRRQLKKSCKELEI